jgi:hypothetical protein
MYLSKQFECAVRPRKVNMLLKLTCTANVLESDVRQQTFYDLRIFYVGYGIATTFE